MSGTVNAIESELKMWPNVDALWSRMLKMRQAEKDFMLYQDSAFLGKHKKFAGEFDLALESPPLSPSTVLSLKKQLTDYTTEMEVYARTYLEQQSQIGDGSGCRLH